MKLNDARFCGNCEEVFDGREFRKCPACASSAALVPLRPVNGGISVGAGINGSNDGPCPVVSGVGSIIVD